MRVLVAKSPADRLGAMLDETTKIFGIGLSRTGTLTLATALKFLGVDALHFPHDPITADELARGHYDLTILRERQALTDITVAPFYAQLDEIVPASKFILTTRPTDTWLASVENHFRMEVEPNRDDFVDFIHACVYGALHFNASRFAYVKQLHEASVRQFFEHRPDQLLVFDIFSGDGWEELCAYLDLPLPNVAFPHENTARTAPHLPSSPRHPKRLRGLVDRARSRRR
jgi:Sulfotransferase domain